MSGLIWLQNATSANRVTLFRLFWRGTSCSPVLQADPVLTLSLCNQEHNHREGILFFNFNPNFSFKFRFNCSFNFNFNFLAML